MVNKPWGMYFDIYRSETKVIKTICVNPKSRLSLQSHKFRNEFWYLNSGSYGYLELDGKLIKLEKNIEYLIPAESKHRLINASEVDHLFIVEIQSGRSCSESDIVRYEDDFGRTN